MVVYDGATEIGLESSGPRINAAVPNIDTDVARCMCHVSGKRKMHDAVKVVRFQSTHVGHLALFKWDPSKTPEFMPATLRSSRETH